MKPISFFLIFIWCYSAYAQNNIIPNPSFEQLLNGESGCCLPGDSYCYNHFNNNVANWKTPQEAHFVDLHSCASSPSCDGKGSQHFAWITSWIPQNIFGYNCNNRTRQSIGVALPNGQTFSPNVTYIIRYKYVNVGSWSQATGTGCDWTQTFNHLRIFASVNGPLSWTANSNQVQELTNANLQVQGIASGCDWKAVQRTFQVTSGQYTSLCFLAETGGFFIDDVEVFVQCDNNFLVQNKDYSLFTDTYDPFAVEGNTLKEESGSMITAGSNVGLNNGTGPVNIGNSSGGQNTKVIYTAQQKITLSPGFNVFSGASFHAALDASCPNNINSRTTPVADKIGFFSEIVGETSGQGILDNKAASLYAIYPTVVGGELHLDNYPEKSIIEIIDLLGKTAATFQVYNSRHTTINLTDVKPGMYSVSVSDESGQRLSIDRIIKD